MGGLEFPGLGQWLTALGGPGFIIGYLLYERRGLQAKVESLQARADEIRLEHMADIRKYSSDIASSLATATAVIQANTVGSERVSSTTNRLAEAIAALSARLESMDDTLDRLESRRAG